MAQGKALHHPGILFRTGLSLYLVAAAGAAFFTHRRQHLFSSPPYSTP
jgi:hypothetical protein